MEWSRIEWYEAGMLGDVLACRGVGWGTDDDMTFSKQQG